MEKVTAGRDALGEFAPELQDSTTMCSSARYGRARISYPRGTGA